MKRHGALAVDVPCEVTGPRERAMAQDMSGKDPKRILVNENQSSITRFDS